MYETVPVMRLDRWLERGYTGKIIDLRDPESYRQSHLSTALNFPYEELMQEPEQAFERLSDGSPILFYCSRGSESMLVCNYFDRRGARVYNLGGGYRFYRGRYEERKPH